MNAPIDTRQARRRQLRCESIPEVLEEVARIQAAAERGELHTSGNWTAGQIMTHVAAWIEYGYEGYPISPPPWFVRWILRWQLKKYLRDGMPAGARIPGIEGGTLGMEELPATEAADRLAAAFQRLETDEPAPYDSPAFGAMTHEDRIQLNLRHAELHLGFLSY